jgi:hypothetical protein
VHAVSLVHDAPGHVPCVPSHATPDPHAGVPALPTLAGPQVPSAVDPRATVQTSHAALHAVWQHTPSASQPLAHWFAVVAAWPLFRPHAPAPSHVEAAPHW